MQFNSMEFMLFFPAVLIIYYIIPRKIRCLFLLVASYFFYASWNLKYSVLIGTSTLLTYVCGILIEKMGASIKKRRLLIGCLLLNFGILFLFKYGNFALSTLDGILQVTISKSISYRFDFLLPVGISFYTFQAVGYVVDVYRGDTKAERNIIKYALFVSFFPQLVAGPIERSKNLLRQINEIERLKLWNARRVTSGAILMVWGLFMKMVISDRVALLVDTVFNSYERYGRTELILGAIGFALQIYCDFGAYSMIAVGVAKIMGVELMENFNTPYFSMGIKDFWNRWHISLSTWFRDYLYIPLGGNKKGKFRKHINTLVVFLASGLWHGANWTFIIWGGCHGVYRVCEDLITPFGENVVRKLRIKTDVFSWKFLKVVVTFVMVTFAWIFFRAENVKDAFGYIWRIFNKPTPWLWFDGGIYELGLDRLEMDILIIALIGLLLVGLIRYLKKETIDQFLMEQNIYFEWGVLIFLIAAIFVFGMYGPTYDPQQFIYFQF